MTTGSRPAPFRVPVTFEGKRGLVLLDQLRTVDEHRLIKHLGKLSARTLSATLRTAVELFTP
jgi:mRNA interferase MazF